MFKSVQKTIFSFLTFLVIFTSIAPNFLVANAVPNPPLPNPNATPAGSAPTTTSTWYNSNFQDWYAKVYDPNNPSEIFGERYTAAQVQWVIYGLFGFLVNSVTGPENAELVQCFLDQAHDINSCIALLDRLISDNGVSTVAQNVHVENPKSFLGSVFASDRPLSGISYFKDKLQNFSLVPTANAQTLGFGFSALKPVQDMWKAMRDVSFGLFVLMAIILSFMIMFRVKISPQVVISVQSAIPKAVMALVLVTFSYAIAGLLVDLMYVVIGFFSLAFAPFVHMTPLAVFNWITLGQWGSINLNLGFLLLGIVYLFLFIVGLILLTVLYLGILGTSLAVGLLVYTASLTWWIFVLILIVAILLVMWIFVKILWSLVKSFAMILILTIFAPLQIAAGVVIPNFGFGTWMKSFLSHLATFAVTSIMTLLSFVFLMQGYAIGFRGFWDPSKLIETVFGPGLVGVFGGSYSAAWPPLLGGGTNDAFVGLLFLAVSFVVFSTIPKSNELVQSIITGKPFAYGDAIGEAAVPLKFGAAGAIDRFEKNRANTNPKYQTSATLQLIKQLMGVR